jgi:hypothetical protein
VIADLNKPHFKLLYPRPTCLLNSIVISVRAFVRWISCYWLANHSNLPAMVLLIFNEFITAFANLAN